MEYANPSSPPPHIGVPDSHTQSHVRHFSGYVVQTYDTFLMLLSPSRIKTESNLAFIHASHNSLLMFHFHKRIITTITYFDKLNRF